MEKKKRIAAFLAVTILLVLLFSAAFIATEADHDCAGENCPICAQIAVCQNILKTFALAVCIAAFPAVFSHVLCRGSFACADAIPRNTLVSLKVKLTN